MSKETRVQVTIEVEKAKGYACLYAKFGEGKVHRTVEINDEINVDFGGDDELLGVEAIRFFEPTEGKAFRHTFVIGEIQKAVERGMGADLGPEFTRFREAADSLCLSS